MVIMTFPPDTETFPETVEKLAVSAGMADSLPETVTVGDRPEVNVGAQDHVWPGWMLIVVDGLAASLSSDMIIGARDTANINTTAKVAKTPILLLMAFMLSFFLGFQAPVTLWIVYLYPATN